MRWPNTAAPRKMCAGQIEAAVRDQEVVVRASLEEIDRTFSELSRRGQEAIRDVFNWSRALSLAVGGLSETVGLGRFFRRLGRQTPAKTAFEQFKVDEPLANIAPIVDRLGPRLEGRDVKDADDLIQYTRREMERLPGGLRDKVIGRLESPASYDRNILKKVREPLDGKL